MELNVSFTDNRPEQASQGNRPLIKGIITAVLILVMLIPTFFISSLVRERQQRQAKVTSDVASKWAQDQTITGPYLYIPYQEKLKDDKTPASTKELILLPEDLSVTGDIIPEERKRSIYKVLLYKSNLNAKGTFHLQLPKDMDPASVIWSDIKLCMGISDFKGIEKKVSIVCNGKSYDLTPGLPTAGIDSSGLSSTVEFTPQMLGNAIHFEMPLQIRGSRQLHFAPLSGNSQFTLQSSWPNPSFDGTSLPSVREVSEGGFSATWTFNKANLPFNTIVTGGGIKKQPFSFGVSMVQPADQYAKTERSVKYALLIIGLTFSLFFIVELMQKKPIHPMQYVLVGLALVIFYTLLLSISEFIVFDTAYLLAASATVLLISLYTKGLFRSWKTAGIFGTTLAGLYAFIFVLIRLEDTALLLGSIGLFIILAAVMYVSRRINWYPASQPVI
jgi:inner membrane protein